MVRRVGWTTAVLAIALAAAAALGSGCGGGGLSVTALDVGSGPRSGHQNVTITGSGFEGATGVSFGSTPVVSFSVADATRIVAVTPAGDLGAKVDVTVTTATDTDALSGAYTYWDYDLELVKGSTRVTYTLDDIRTLIPVTGYWGAVNDKPYDTDQYRGVPVLSLLEGVGGCQAGEEIVARSADGFSTVYTPEMLAQMATGTYPMWNVNGTQVITDDRFAQLVLTYEIDTQNDGSSWAPLKAGKGPFRIVALTAEDGRMSQGPANPALVVSLEVRAASAAAASPAGEGTPAATSGQPAGGQGAGSATGSSSGTGAALSVASLDITSGPRSGYQNVTLNGNGFDGVTGVSFSSTPAVDFTVVDSARIVAVTPVGDLGKKVDVTVTAATGADTLPGAYTYWGYDLRLVKGTASVTYSLDELEAMPSVTGYWGAHKDPVPHDTDQYRGVALLELLKAVGGWSPGDEITLTTADDFSITYSAELLQQMAGGTYPMWNVNGTEIISADRFAQPIVAYAIDPAGDGSSWEPLEAGTGPLRMAIITAEPDRVSQGKFNPFLVTLIELKTP